MAGKGNNWPEELARKLREIVRRREYDYDWPEITDELEKYRRYEVSRRKKAPKRSYNDSPNTSWDIQRNEDACAGKWRRTERAKAEAEAEAEAKAERGGSTRRLSTWADLRRRRCPPGP